MVTVVVRAAPTPSTGVIKWHPGMYLGSYNVNGTTNGRNATEINAFKNAVAGGCPLLGWMPSYTWSALENAFGAYNFSPIITDFNNLLAAVPTARMSICINTRTFAQHFQISSIVAGTVPAYILSGSPYGLGTNGTQHGYTLATFDAAHSEYTEIAATTWRNAVMVRYGALLAALANTPLTASVGPHAGQTYTFNTHPQIEQIYIGEESALSSPAAPNSDFNYTSYRTQLAALYTTMIAAWPNTNCISELNFVGTQSAALGFVQDMASARMCMGGPDLFASAHDNWCQQVFMGNYWNGSVFVPNSGPSFINKAGSMPWVQEPDYAVATGNTLASIYASGMQLGASHIMWGYIADGGIGDFNTNLVPFLKANSAVNTICPSSYGNTCLVS